MVRHAHHHFGLVGGCMFAVLAFVSMVQPPQLTSPARANVAPIVLPPIVRDIPVSHVVYVKTFSKHAKHRRHRRH